MNNVYKNIIVIAFFAIALLTPAVFSLYVFAETLSVSTQSPSQVGETTAVINGFVSNPGGRSTLYFEWGGGGASGLNTSGGQELNGSGVFQSTMTGLLPGRSYFYRAIAISYSTGEKVTGNTVDFTTSTRQFASQQTPTIETRTATDVTGVSAVLNGAVNPQGSSDTVRWFEWGVTQSLGKQTPKANQGTSAGSFSYGISDLSVDAIYYYRAVAQNANGLITGSLYSFRTGNLNYLPTTPGTTDPSAKPIVITQSPNVVSDRSAVISGIAFPSASIETRGWFEWGKTSALGSQTVVQNIGNNSTINYSEDIPSLSQNTTYFYRAVIENSRGKAEGSILSFTTGSAGVGTGTTGGTKPATTGTKDPKDTKNNGDDKTNNNNTAAVGGFFSDCFPNSLIGWLILILIIILIVIALDHLIDRYNKRKEVKKRQNEMNEGEPRIIK